MLAMATSIFARSFGPRSISPPGRIFSSTPIRVAGGAAEFLPVIFPVDLYRNC